MIFAKLVDGVLYYAPRRLPAEIGGELYIVFNPTAQMLYEDGWLPVIFTDSPDDPPAGYHYEPVYAEDPPGEAITQGWTLVQDPDDISADEALEIIIGGGGNDEE